MWQRMVGVALVTIIAIGGREANAQTGSPRIRPEGAAVREFVELVLRARNQWDGLVARHLE